MLETNRKSAYYKSASEKLREWKIWFSPKNNEVTAKCDDKTSPVYRVNHNHNSARKAEKGDKNRAAAAKVLKCVSNVWSPLIRNAESTR